jgi:hypothetical protein
LLVEPAETDRAPPLKVSPLVRGRRLDARLAGVAVKGSLRTGLLCALWWA